ncbi:MAG TPA: hypothetical protein VEH10_03810 [Thermoplasmata archaeon]|nr:hypothetical protein [Thermoplasmata archaeon]
MTTNTRVSLTILSLGFAIEGGGELYSFVSRGAYRPGVSLLFLLPVVMTVAGLLFVWVGRHEWNELHRARVRQAHLVFALSLLGALVGGVLVAVLLAVPSLGTPLWARGLFGAAIGSLVLGTFVTYALLVFHLVPRPSKALLLASLLWSLGVAGFVGAAMGTNLPTILGLASHRTLTLPTFVGPVDSLASYLFVSYFLLLAAYLDAHRTIARGPEAPAAAPPVAPGDPARGARPGRE